MTEELRKQIRKEMNKSLWVGLRELAKFIKQECYDRSEQAPDPGTQAEWLFNRDIWEGIIKQYEKQYPSSIVHYYERRENKNENN